MVAFLLVIEALGAPDYITRPDQIARLDDDLLAYIQDVVGVSPDAYERASKPPPQGGASVLADNLLDHFALRRKEVQGLIDPAPCLFFIQP